jgi:hypothetical protein
VWMFVRVLLCVCMYLIFRVICVRIGFVYNAGLFFVVYFGVLHLFGYGSKVVVSDYL